MNNRSNKSNFIVDVYLKPERYNPRIRAIGRGAWVALYANGQEMSLCREYEAASSEAAMNVAFNNSVI